MTMLVAALSLFAASSASAASGPAMLGMNGTPGVASNTGAVSGNATSLGAHVFSVAGSVQARCNDLSLSVTAVATDVVTVDPQYGGCGWFVAGTSVATLTVDTPCDWTLSFADGTFDSGTGAASGGTLTTNCVTDVTIPAWPCTFHLAAQTRPGLSLQNADVSGTNSTAATPWGSKLIFAVSGLTFSATGSCAGLPAEGTMGYSGAVAVRNIFGKL